MAINKYWTKEQLREAMDNFSADFKNKKYSERIEYELWRKIRNIKDPVISYEDTVINIYERYDCDLFDNKKIASFKVYDWGFGRFLYDNYFKEEVINNMSSISATTTTKNNSSTITNTATNTTSGIVVKGDSISNIADSISVDNYGNLYWNDRTTVDTTYATSVSKVDSCDICYHKNKCNNCYYMKKTNENKNNEGGKTNMNGFNFDFGPCGNTVRLSVYGMAIQNISGEWVSYNPDSHEIINVDVFNIADGGKYMYKIPVAIADVKIGDIVIHNRVPMFVTAINENGTFDVTDVRAGEAKTVIPTRSPFGFNFITKIVSLFGVFTDVPTADQPFGNMLPFLMLGDDNKDIDPMMIFFMMNQNGSNMFSNPMMMYFLMKDNKDFDPMLMLMMMNQNTICGCDKHTEKPTTQV